LIYYQLGILYFYKMNREQIEDDLTYKIIGFAMKIHTTLGNGFQGVIYQRALAIEEKSAFEFY
jgi:hypothetical protein